MNACRAASVCYVGLVFSGRDSDNVQHVRLSSIDHAPWMRVDAACAGAAAETVIHVSVSRAMKLPTCLFAAWFIAFTVSFRAQPAPPTERHVILVTIDGMRGDYLGEADRYHLGIPHLRRLMRDGSFSARTFSVFPTLTGTAHTALVTGTGAMKHGILGNNRFDTASWVYRADNPDNYDAQPPYRDHSDIKAATLWSVARAKGLKTAAIGWPQTAGGPIDYRLDIVMAGTGPESHQRTIRAAATPAGGWLDRIERQLGPLQAVDLRMVDHVKALAAAEILKQFRPGALRTHLHRPACERPIDP